MKGVNVMKRNFKRSISVLTLIVLVVMTMTFTVHANQNTADANANAKTKDTLNWLSNLQYRGDNKVIIGQYVTRQANNTDGRTPAQAWQYYFEDLYNATGKYPGMAGFDFSTKAKNQQSGDNTPGDSNWRSYAVEHYNNKGTLRFMWHASNPWTGGNAWTEIPAGSSLKDIITPGNSAYDTWISWLDTIAGLLQYYESNNITVIWGPLHESNGSWFWWGTGTGSSDADFVLVWQHMFNYFTNTKGLHNLIWAYCPDNGASVTTSVNKYPGNSYVDVIAPDRYTSGTNSPSTAHYTEFTQSGYGKVFGWGEAGTKAAGGAVDNRKYINEIMSIFPKTAFYMQWMDVEGDAHSIRANNYADEVMDEDWILTRNEMGDYSVYIIDNNNTLCTKTGTWSNSTLSSGYRGTNYSVSAAGTGADYVVWKPNLAEAGNYGVYYWQPAGTSAMATNTQFTVYYNGGSQTYTVNQQTAVGGQWILLGTHNFAAGTGGYVKMTDNANNWVVADGIKFQK